jgi:hypothetical protein
MAGPFPGIDPYLELQAGWRDFHHCLITGICNELGARLPDSYVARVNERTEVVTAESNPPSSYPTNALAAHFESGEVNPTMALAQTLSVTIEPKFAEILDCDLEDVRIIWVEIRALPGLELVTTVEILSPINKSGQGRRRYLERRNKIHASHVNLVEIDLLNGAPLPMKQPIEPGAYYAIVARGPRLPVAEVYCWTVRDRIPCLPIPLREPNPDIVIDLGALVTRVYDLGRYDRTLRHDMPLPETIALAPEDRAWVESMSRTVRRENL